MSEKLDELTNNEPIIDLKKSFPLPMRSIFRESFKWLALSATVLCFLIYAYYIKSQNQNFNPSIAYQKTFIYIFFLIILIALLRLLYQFIYHKTYSYGIETGHLVVTHGIFHRQRSSFPIDSISDILLDRNIIDMVFGLYTVFISTASSEIYTNSNGPTIIKNMKQKDAAQLQNFLTELIRATRPEIQDVNEIVKDMKNDLKS